MLCRHSNIKRMPSALLLLYVLSATDITQALFLQMKPTGCTLLLSIFISTSLHVSGDYVPIIRRTYCIYATLVFFTLYGWLSGLLVGMRRIYIYIYIFIQTHTHISYCVKTVYELPLLQNNTAVKHFYTNREQCEVLTGYLSLGCQPGGDWGNT